MARGKGSYWRSPPQWRPSQHHWGLATEQRHQTWLLFYREGVLLYKGRLVISAEFTWIPTLLKEYHSTPQGGHSGFYHSYKRLTTSLFWVGMKKDVKDFVKECDVCQCQKYLAVAPGGLLQPLNIPNQIWEEISMDFITGLPKSKRYTAILVVVDHLSKYSHFIPLKHP